MAVMPKDNPMAVVGYYLGVISLIPCLGIITALPAIICGIIGLVKTKKDPSISGKGHAITAIVLGLGGPLLWAGLVAIWNAMG